MAAEVLPLQPLRPPPAPESGNPEQAYWKSFKNHVLLASPHNTGITSITQPDHNPTGTQADVFATTAGRQVQIYSTKTRKQVKAISRFGVEDTARSGVFRRDGRIVLASGDSGVMQAFDASSRAILRQWRGEAAHRLPVHAVRWNPSVLTEFMSASDDRTVRTWDLTEEEARWAGVGHEDYVRTGCYLPDQPGMIVSGSYDQTVRLWDTRQARPAMTFKHVAPVEAVLALNGSTLACAAGNEVSILNLGAGKVENVVRAHQKTVTSLSTAQAGTRLLTGALDGHVKVHNTSSWEVAAGLKYPAPVLSLAVITTTTGNTTSDRHLAVGLETGVLSLRTRLAGTEKAKAAEKEKRMQALIAGEADEYERKQRKKDLRQGIRARDRGKDFRGEGADIIITGNDRSRQSFKKLQPWQKCLREGKYAQALDLVMDPRGGAQAFNHEDVLTLLTALRHRSALRAALVGRSEARLMPTLRWCAKNVGHPRHGMLVHDTLLLILELYAGDMPGWDAIEDGESEGRAVLGQIRKIEKNIRLSVEWAQKADCLLGMVECLEAG